MPDTLRDLIDFPIYLMDRDKPELPEIARGLLQLGFELVATSGTAHFLRDCGIEVGEVNKVREGSPHIVDLLGQGEISLVINTPEGSAPLLDSTSIRLVANELSVPTYTTMAAAAALVPGIDSLQRNEILQVGALQDYHHLA